MQKGFTFVELMLVVIIIGVLASISTPLFRRTFNDIQLANASQEIVSLTRYARQKAIVERNLYRLNLDSYKNSYWLTKCDLSAESKDEFQKLEGKFGRHRRLPKGIKLVTKKKNMCFYPDGTSDGITFSLTNQNQRKNTLTTKGIRGSVGIIEE